MRVLIDYRPALREPTGVGEYIHRLVEALPETVVERGPLAVTVFSSSWRDRLTRSLPPQVSSVDLRWPVRVLNLLWHRCRWPTIERLTGQQFDVVHAPHPLLVPARHAAQVVTVHDLDFLDHPERTAGEIRRDYPRLVRRHVHLADRVVVPSRYTAERVHTELDVPGEKISLCPNGVPEWVPRSSWPRPGHLLFVGTLAPRKNVRTLLAAYEQILVRRPDVPDLVLAGGIPKGAEGLEAARRMPLAAKVRLPGYVAEDELRGLYGGARMLILPSFDEGFGRPVLEAMTMGVPVVASARGAVPEIVDDAGLLFDPADTQALVAAIERVLDDEGLVRTLVRRGFERARRYTWHASALALRDAYDRAVEDHLANRHRRA